MDGRKKWRLNYMEQLMRRVFEAHGQLVVSYPWLFIIMPTLIAGVLGGGLVFRKTLHDVEYLFTPQESEAWHDERLLHNDFKGVTNFSLSRMVDINLVLHVLITHKTGSSVWGEDTLNEIFALDHHIVTMETQQHGLEYKAVCEKYNGSCVVNRLDLLRETRKLKYPVHKVAEGEDVVAPSEVLFLGFLLGGVSTDTEGYIKDVQAIQLLYPFKDARAGREWANRVLNKLSNDTFKHLKLDMWHYFTTEQELAAQTKRIIPFFFIIFTLLSSFSIFATLLLDQVQSKPWLGVCGVVSTGMSTLSAAGLLLYTRLPMVDMVAAAPFLVLGIGVDDMFVMLAAWRNTNHYLPASQRIPAAFSEAAMSITIVSVTDIIVIGIGGLTPFPSVQIFCAYTGLMMFFHYFYQITFFAGCMAVAGQREEQNRHVWTCQVIPAKSQAPDGSACYRMCCTGGIPADGTYDEVDNPGVWGMTFFRDYVARFIVHPAGTTIIFLFFALYMAAAIWGCTTITLGLEIKNFAADDSFMAAFYAKEEQYFSKYNFYVQVVIRSPLNSPEKINRTLELIAELEKTEFFHGPELTIAWLRDYIAYAEKTNHTIDYTNMFRDKHWLGFLQIPAYSDYDDDTRILKDVFRFLLMTDIGVGTDREIQMMVKSREIAKRYKELNVVVYSPRFLFTEQYVAVLPNTIQNLGIAVGSTMIIALIFIAQPLICLWVTWSVVSISVGVVGFMGIWGVHLDVVSMINIIMCIGFCVDFSAHISYAFVTSDLLTGADRIADALYRLGMPIVHGSISTILAIIPLAFSHSYIFNTFFKVMFLVILFGTLQSIFVLPAILSLHGPAKKSEEEIILDQDGRPIIRPRLPSTLLNLRMSISSGR